MDNRVLLVDFGSTFTKVVYVDLEENRIISRATHYSTVDTDITEGLKACFTEISERLGIDLLSTSDAIACSSAAGGLRIVCLGFVPDYSSEAANRAALGAGAKVAGCFSYEVTEKEIEEIEALDPDIILLTGGTDGGDKKVIIHNAQMLARYINPRWRVIVAGNKAAGDDIRAAFQGTENSVIFADNVMPAVARIDVDSCNRKIREIFINNIIDAKGIGKARTMVKNILMPTPSAVLAAARLLADGIGDQKGLGELMIVDVGGATTDIHSIAQGNPKAGVIPHAGLPEPYEKRTVEGDLGLKFNLERLMCLLDERGGMAGMQESAQRLTGHGFIPEASEDMECHTRLSQLAVEVAVNRHAGRIEIKYGPGGETLVQYGKDLTGVKSVIGTGGPIIFAKDPREVLSGALFEKERLHSLKPKNPRLFIDVEYILYAGGLLSQVAPEKAFQFMKKHLKEV